MAAKISRLNQITDVICLVLNATLKHVLGCVNRFMLRPSPVAFYGILEGPYHTDYISLIILHLSSLSEQ